MSFLSKIHVYCFLLSYLAALACEILHLLRKRTVVSRAALFGMVAAGFFAHTAYLFTRSRQVDLPPLLASQKDWLLVLAWLGSATYLVLLLTHGKLAHGLFMLPAILLLIVVAIFVNDQGSGNLRALALRRWGMLHATSLVLGIGAVVAAAISGLMYLLHHQHLRRRSRWLQNIALPSLEVLTSFNRWMVVFSVPCLTIGLLTGFFLISISPHRTAENAVSWTDPTIVTTVLVWIAMVVVLSRVLHRSQQTGKAVALLSLLSGGFLLVSILGPMVLSGSSLHGRPSASAIPEINLATPPAEDGK
jgi:hypothetical protein